VTTAILHGASSGVLVQSLEPGNIIVRADNGHSVTLFGGSVNVRGAAFVGSGQGILRDNHLNGDVTLAIAYPAPATPPAPQASSHVTGGPEGGFFGDLGSSILDAGKAIGRGVEGVITLGSPTPGTPGAGGVNTSTKSQQ
jgi:hypothetical protein